MKIIMRLYRKMALLLLLVLVALPCAIAAGSLDNAKQIRNFVHSVHIHGVPYHRVQTMNKSVGIPLLIRMLKNRREEQWWANIAVTLGMTGSNKAVDPLIVFIKSGGRKLSRAATNAKTSAVMSLGYIVNKTGNRKALNFLKVGANPESWKSHAFNWRGSYHATIVKRDNHLTTMAVLGLGLSGHKEARAVLTKLQRLRGPSIIKSRIPNIKAISNTALREHTFIRKRGMNQYYKIKFNKLHGPGSTIRLRPERVRPLPRPTQGKIIRAAKTGKLIRPVKRGQVIKPLTRGKVLKPLTQGKLITPSVKVRVIGIPPK